MDQHFLDKALRTAGLMAALIAVCAWQPLGTEWALAFLLAAGWSILNLWALAWLLIGLFHKAGLGRAALFLCLKVPVLYGLIILYLFYVSWQPSALIAGITLPYAVMVLKALGRFLIEAMNRA